MRYINNEGLCYYLGTKPTRLGVKFDRQKHENIVEILKRHNVKSILEIGPGRGYLADFCEGFEYEAIDKDPDICEMMRSRGFVCYELDVPPLCVPKRYDAIVCCNVIEHLKAHEKVIELIEDIHKHLNNKGIVIIQTPELKYWKWYFWDISIDHFFPTSRRRIESLCINAGFEILLSEIWLDCFKGMLAKFIWYMTRLVPPVGKVLKNIRHKYLCCVVVARKK